MRNRKKLWTAMPALIVLLLLVTAVTSYAWLCTDKAGEFKLSADKTPDLSLYMATWQNGSYVWGQEIPMQENHLGKGSFGAPFDINKQSNGGNDLHFGLIDNLTRISESNRAWFCLKVHKEEGMFFDARIKYGANNPVKLFGSIWSGGKPGELKEMALPDGALNSLSKLMEVQPAQGNAFVTTTGPVAGGTFTPPEVAQTKDYIRLASDATVGMVGKATDTDADGYYYIYFRVSPNLDQYYVMVENLYEVMPCYLSFNGMQVVIDVKTQQNAA